MRNVPTRAAASLLFRRAGLFGLIRRLSQDFRPRLSDNINVIDSDKTGLHQ